MKVLLVNDVRKLGWLGDVVEVKDGYARNYLLPQGLATQASEANIKAIASAKAERAEQRLAERKQMEIACAAVDGAEAVITAKANEQGHLFGSVSQKQIAENLREQGYKVADDIVELSGHIKEVGSHFVKLYFTEGVEATVKVTVIAEGAEGIAAQSGDTAHQAESGRQEKESGSTDTLQQ
ncbi:MAG: 50S ribosomal protein L9 [Phycisphaerae bacterium]